MGVMNSVSTRLYVVVGIILGAYGIGRLVQAAAEPPQVERPKWSVKDLPMQLGSWRGEDAEINPEIAAATGAYAIANRIYSNGKGQSVSLHTAMFDDPSEGVYHSPLNCYRSSGWTQKKSTQADIKVSEDLTIPVKLVTWEKNEHERIIVAYWYQLGEYTLYSRLDLGGSIRWKMRGQAKWPVLIKVMLQIPLSDADETQETLLAFGKQLSQWINSPEHRQYLNRWGGV
jgi:EpsI family protein